MLLFKSPFETALQIFLKKNPDLWYIKNMVKFSARWKNEKWCVQISCHEQGTKIKVWVTDRIWTYDLVAQWLGIWKVGSNPVADWDFLFVPCSWHFEHITSQTPHLLLCPNHQPCSPNDIGGLRVHMLTRLNLFCLTRIRPKKYVFADCLVTSLRCFAAKCNQHNITNIIYWWSMVNW